VILEGADSALCSITTMDMWRHQLEIHLLCFEKIFEMDGGFIVEFLKLWLEATFY
jgi:hypothetical protein